jgi:transcriptional regulator with XRE-family HTH domain
MQDHATVFVDRLREAIGDRTHRQVCAAIGKSRRALTGWLAGENQPTVRTIVALCRTLDVSADWLLGLQAAPRKRRRRRAG